MPAFFPVYLLDRKTGPIYPTRAELTGQFNTDTRMIPGS